MPRALIHELVEEQARHTPDAIAIEDEHGTLTYASLVERAKQVEGWLASRGVALEDRVAISVTRSADMAAALLGVLGAGAAYVPIDPTFPDERRAFIRSDARAVVEIDDRALAEALAGGTSSSSRRCSPPPSIAAYLLYTSGSTGKPKGVVVSHRSVVRFLRAMQREPGIAPEDVLVAVTTLSFDIAGLELYLPLVSGAKVVAPRATAADPRALALLIERSRATMMQATPTTWRMLLVDGWRPKPGFEILTGGEPIPPDLAAALVDAGAEVWNMYGPTETTVWSTCARLDGREVTIGKPIDDTSAYVLAPSGQPAPMGANGELTIGGAGVARGYFERPALTAERFVPDPFSSEPGARMYRTGDVARLRVDGKLEVSGRLDDQIKLHGTRIELGEIDAALASHADVRDAAVVLRDDGHGPYLAAYVTASRSDRPPEIAELREWLGRSLTNSMVPAAYAVLDGMPLTSNGKLDRRALLARSVPLIEGGHDRPGERAADAQTDLERCLVAIWTDELRVGSPAVDVPFELLGGHSLTLARVVAALRRRGHDVALGMLHPSMTVRDMGRAIAHVEERRAGPAEAPSIRAVGGVFRVALEIGLAVLFAFLVLRVCVSAGGAHHRIVDVGGRGEALVAAIPRIAAAPAPVLFFGSSEVATDIDARAIEAVLERDGHPATCFNLGLAMLPPRLLRTMTSALRDGFAREGTRARLGVVAISTSFADSWNGSPDLLEQYLMAYPVADALPIALEVSAGSAASVLAGRYVLGGFTPLTFSAYVNGLVTSTPAWWRWRPAEEQGDPFGPEDRRRSRSELGYDPWGEWRFEDRGGYPPPSHPGWAAVRRLEERRAGTDRMRDWKAASTKFLGWSTFAEESFVDGSAHALVSAIATLRTFADDVVLVVPPLDPYAVEKLGAEIEGWRKVYARIAEVTHAPLHDLLTDGRFGPEDFVDAAHLNARGRDKLTPILAELLAPR